MNKIILVVITALLFLGCSKEDINLDKIEAKLVVNKSLSDLKLNDQYDKPQTIHADTKKVIFAFSKEVGHLCNDFFATKDDGYLINNKVQFIADVSKAPSIIRSMFIMPGLADFNHPILVLDNEKTSTEYRTGHNIDKILVVYLENKIITKIIYLNNIDELSREIETH